MGRKGAPSSMLYTAAIQKKQSAFKCLIGSSWSIIDGWTMDIEWEENFVSFFLSHQWWLHTMYFIRTSQAFTCSFIVLFIALLSFSFPGSSPAFIWKMGREPGWFCHLSGCVLLCGFGNRSVSTQSMLTALQVFANLWNSPAFEPLDSHDCWSSDGYRVLLRPRDWHWSWS